MKISLEKRSEKVKGLLDKRNVNNIPCEVGLILDGSGSMQSNYYDGTVQEVVERVLAIAMQVDRDQKVDCWTFANSFRMNKTVTLDNISEYVNNYAIKYWTWGGTSYAPVLKEAINSFFPSKSGLFSIFKKKLDAPVLLIFITDGDADDNSQCDKVIEDASKKNVYIQLLGIGSGSYFSYLQKTASIYDNVGFLPIRNISSISEEDLYDGLLNDEWADWVKKFK